MKKALRKLTASIAVAGFLINFIPEKSFAYYVDHYDAKTVTSYQNYVASGLTYAQAEAYLINSKANFENTKPNFVRPTAPYAISSIEPSDSSTTSMKELTIGDEDNSVGIQGTNRVPAREIGYGVAGGIIASAGYGLLSIGFEKIMDIINRASVQNGWVDFGPAYTYDTYSRWGYRISGEWASNQWISSSGKWYYIKSNHEMFDPRYNKSEWSLAPASNGSYITRWFRFNPNGNGDMLGHAAGWDTDYYNKKGKWIYWMPGDTGIATDEPVMVNGERFLFDKDGYCWYGRGCN
ncbi:hypothetical protein [Bacillus salipaludis]|uniref:Cell wall-binding protein n=1 Tax=Bacillus salipaludis TaxID=2547811 RepID=A0ABW8RQ00_9BACI